MSGLHDILKPKTQSEVGEALLTLGNEYSLTKKILSYMNGFDETYEANKHLVIFLIKNENFDSPSSLRKIFEESCKLGKIEIVKAVIEKNIINPAESNNFGLRQAYTNNHLNVVKFLMENDAVRKNLSETQLSHLEYHIAGI